MNPKHIEKITDKQRRAIAPYNFVELPEQIVPAQQPLPEGDRYHTHLHTGRIDCTLTTESPLYTRCGWSPEDFAKYGETAFNDSDEIKKLRANFFINPATNQPMIPGSSIRGMLRTLVEIISFSKIDQVSGAQKLFFRAVAAEKKDPLKHEYRLENVQAGYLKFDKDHGKWYVYSALILDSKNNLSYLPVKEVNIKRDIRSLILMKKNNYLPQYIDISFEVNANGDVLVSEDVQKYPSPENQGILVTSGNMLETSNLTEAEKEAKLKSKKGRKYHYIISKQYSSPKPIEISQEAIFNYISALTDFQSGKLFKDNSKNPFDHALGVLKNNRPIFYCQPKLDQPIILFGQSPNFRIPYSPQGNGEASTARDFIPSYLKNSKDKPTINDIAEAILGFVRRDKQPEKINQSCASRVFITDATLQPNQDEKVKSSLNKDPQEIILSSPKPTTFQHYLVQTSDKKPELKHYASQPPTDTEPGETVIRGHKLYWHNKEYKKLEPPENSDTQTSLIKPIDPGIEFTFDIHFENLSDVELGALLWILSLSSDKSQQLETGKTDEKYCFSLGMGKPLGMGAVKINYNFHLSDRTARYSQLFDSNGWSQDEKEQDEVTQAEINCISEFEKYVLDRISENDYPDNQNRQQLEHLRQIPRIEMLLAMLQCDPLKEAAYMELETFKDRKVLPTPLDIRKIEDKRRFPTNSTPSSKTASKPKPQKKSDHPKQEPENKVNLATQRAARPPKPKS